MLAEAAVLEATLHSRRGNFSLQIECRFPSPWTVLFGPSGAGKTTLLRLLAGLDRDILRTHGSARVVFDGNTLTDTATGVWTLPGRRRTALVTQHPALFPHLTVFQNVAYGLRSLDRNAQAQRVKEMLALVAAEPLIDRRPQGLSGGEAQRVALARALAPAPQLLLLDEPFSALDGTTSDFLLDRLQPWLRAAGVQTVLATHDAADAFATGAEVALIHEGRVAAQGPAAQVLAPERNRLLERLTPSGD